MKGQLVEVDWEMRLWTLSPGSTESSPEVKASQIVFSFYSLRKHPDATP